MNTLLCIVALAASGQAPVSPQVVEAIGERGAAALAAERGLTPILTAAEKSVRQGFDQVYRSGKQVVVIEAKGGSSRLGVARGFAQASEGWTLEVARETLKRASATQAELNAAREILAAAPRGDLTIEVVRTRMRDGQLRTTVEKVVQTQDKVTMQRLAAAIGVALELYARVQRALEIEVAFRSGEIDLAERDKRHLKNVGGSIGAIGAVGAAMLLVGPQGIAVSIAVGGGSYLIGDWLGSRSAVLLADWLHDRGISVSESCEALAAKAAEAGAETWDWVQQSGGAAWSWSAEQGALAWSWARDASSDAWQWTARKSDAGWNWTKVKADSSWRWTEAKADSAWDWTRTRTDSTWSWTSSHADRAWNWAQSKAEVGWKRTSESTRNLKESAEESGKKAWNWLRQRSGATSKQASRKQQRKD